MDSDWLNVGMQIKWKIGSILEEVLNLLGEVEEPLVLQKVAKSSQSGCEVCRDRDIRKSISLSLVATGAQWGRFWSGFFSFSFVAAKYAIV